MKAGHVVPGGRVVTEDEVKALVTIETMERLIVRAGNLLTREGRLESDVVAAALLLDEACGIATARTCTAVKSQELSDRISHEASTRFAQATAAVRRITNPVSKPSPFEVGARVTSTYGDEHRGVVTDVKAFSDGAPMYLVKRDSDGFVWIGMETTTLPE